MDINVNDPRNNCVAKFNENISIETSLKNQRIMDNVNKTMAELTRKRLENSNKVLNPPILPIPPPLMSIKIGTNPVERSSPINIVFDSICYLFYKGNCINNKCKYKHQLPTTDQIIDRLKTFNQIDFIEIYKLCVTMTTLLKQCWFIFIEVAVFNKWNQFLDIMIESSNAYRLEDINKMWRKVFHAFTECNMTKQQAVSHFIRISGKFRKLPHVEILIDLMVETNLLFFLKEIVYFISLFKGKYQANAFVIEQFYEAVLNKQEPDPGFLKVAHSIACNMNPNEACEVDQNLIRRFCEKYYSVFPDEAN